MDRGQAAFGKSKRVVKFSRMPRYSKSEDAAIIKYVRAKEGKKVAVRGGKHNAVQQVELTATGTLLFKHAAAENITGTNRSWDSLKDRYLKYLR